ncbi:type VII secretion protein EccCa [Dactylosporangium sp. NPDC050688]|uniref:type VII secretion protein EccCa n=1 Tax=Dactylosporangium sp. NPDC050688 TaxID=3157217 RepID=UPI003401CF4C
MSLVIVNRPPRRAAPVLPSGEVVLEPPPDLPTPSGRGWMRLLMVLPMAAGAGGMGLMMGVGRSGPLMYVAGAMYGVSILGMMAVMLVNQSGPSKKEMVEVRRQFMRRLSQHRAQVRETTLHQREAIAYRYPVPADLWAMVTGPRLWERRRGDVDFGVLRLGVGPQALATALVPPQTRPVDELDPLCAMALRQFVVSYAVVPDLPVAIALRDFARVYLRGSTDRGRALLRAVVAQAATFHAPDDLLIAVCAGDAERPAWEWAKWLPHAQHPAKSDAAGALRLFAAAATGLEAMLDDVLANRVRFNPALTAKTSTGPHLVVIIDGGSITGSDHIMTEGGVEGVTVIDLSNPPPRMLGEAMVVLTLDADGGLTAATMDGTTDLGRADELDPVEAEALARELGPLRLSAAPTDVTAMNAGLGLAELLELGEPDDFDPARTWAGRPSRDRLRVPFGVSLDGRRVELDLKESAQDGMGPHGLLVGATGSGKSELLRTLVLALAVTHSSETLNFVLVDFKGGATFATLDRLPHTSAVITNLADEMPLVDRMLDAIQGELVRRQELLRVAGNYASLRDYERARASGVPLAPLPSLLLICDEFSELISARPEFIDMFVQIGRVGRSLGIHLLLATQRLEEGRLRGLETHLSYRLGLRTFSSMESRAVLGVPDAYELPRSPGHGYLRIGTEDMIRFRAAYVSGRHQRDGGTVTLAGRATDVVRDFGTYYLAQPVEDEPASLIEEPEDALGQTLLDTLVARLQGRGPLAHQVWLPPLQEPLTLDELLAPPVDTPERGLTVEQPDRLGRLHSLVGVVDKPFEQRRDPMWIDLSGARGNLVVVGAARTGKSTFLRTLIAGLALTHTPREAQFYCLDFGGGTLAQLAELPHVGAVAARTDVNRVRRTVAEVYGLLQLREEWFATSAVDGIDGYRRLLRERPSPVDPFGDVFLVVDGWATLRDEFEDLESLVTSLATRGLGYGIHVVGSAARWMDLRAAQRDAFGTRLELRLGDPTDSLINRRAAVNVPEQAPGRGLTPDGQHFLTALPRIDGRADPDTLSDGLAELVERTRAGWSGPVAPQVRLLPALLPYEALPAPVRGAGGRLPIGIAEVDLAPVYLEFDAEPHALAFGDVESGKSSFLRGLARTITSAYEPSGARIILIDQRRSLLGCVDTDHLIGYGSSAATTASLVADVVTVMRERLPGNDVTPAQLRSRSWWKGPELYVLIDDYDLIATGGINPLEPLIEFLPQARDIGLHLVVTRRVGGASRAMFDPLIGRIRELASPGVLMSGPKEEGPIFGAMSPQVLPPGRAWLINRRQGARLIQLAWTPPSL